MDQVGWVNGVSSCPSTATGTGPAAVGTGVVYRASDGFSAADYRVAPMDVLDVTVYDAPNLSRPAQVSASGVISLPLIGDVRATGKTIVVILPDSAERYLSSALFEGMFDEKGLAA